MRRLILAVLVLAVGAVGAPVAWAGSPHFVDSTVTASRSGNTLTVSGKEAGLGEEPEIKIVITATAECINKGEKHPKAENKGTITTQFPVTVQNGKANFSETLTATFKPECSPPMTLAFTNVKVEDETNKIFVILTGTF